MSPKHRFASIAYAFLLALLLMSLPHKAQAGDKLRKLKEDAVRIQKGTLLVAPILPDSFVLRKFDHAGGEAKRAAYLESIRISNVNLQQALQKHYHFSKMQVMPAVADCHYTNTCHRNATLFHTGGNYFPMRAACREAEFIILSSGKCQVVRNSTGDLAV